VKDFLWTMDRDRNGHDGRNGQEWTAEWTMDNGQGQGQEWTRWTEWTMDNGQGQEWTGTAGDIFLCLSIRPLNVKSIASMMSIRVPVH
jgi:hypothetical protein